MTNAKYQNKALVYKALIQGHLLSNIYGIQREIIKIARFVATSNKGTCDFLA